MGLLLSFHLHGCSCEVSKRKSYRWDFALWTLGGILPMGSKSDTVDDAAEKGRKSECRFGEACEKGN